MRMTKLVPIGFCIVTSVVACNDASLERAAAAEPKDAASDNRSGVDSAIDRAPLRDTGSSSASCRLANGLCRAGSFGDVCCTQNAVRYDFGRACWSSKVETLACEPPANSQPVCNGPAGIACLIREAEGGPPEAWRTLGNFTGVGPGFVICQHTQYKDIEQAPTCADASRP